MTKSENSWGIHSSEIAWAGWKERDRVGVGPVAKQVVKGGNDPTWRPRPPCWVVTPFHYLLCNRTHPYPVTLLPIGSGYFRAIDTTIILRFSHFTSTCLWRWNRQSVPKRRHIRFRRRVITQKKTYNIQNTAKVWNQGIDFLVNKERCKLGLH